MKKPLSLYNEGYANLDLGAGFFRKDSVVSRDFSVLFAAMQFQEKNERKILRWLDVMSGCGIRALRWSLEAAKAQSKQISFIRDLELFANDCDLERYELINRNFRSFKEEGIKINISNDFAERFFFRAAFQKLAFDFIDIDAFGCPNYLLYPAIQVLSPNGLLAISNSDGRSPTGHDRLNAIRSFGAAARAHPASWEIALRIQLAVIARQSWLLGLGFEPLVSFSDGRTFRCFVRLGSRILREEEKQIGFIARCNVCGAQLSQTLFALKDWEQCLCGKGFRSLSVNGPLWLGPLQSSEALGKISSLVRSVPIPVSQRTIKLLKRLEFDNGIPIFSWNINELSSRISLMAPPPLALIVDALTSAGFKASRNGIVPGHLRTDAPIGDLLRICKDISLKALN